MPGVRLVDRTRCAAPERHVERLEAARPVDVRGAGEQQRDVRAVLLHLLDGAREQRADEATAPCLGGGRDVRDAARPEGAAARPAELARGPVHGAHDAAVVRVDGDVRAVEPAVVRLVDRHHERRVERSAPQGVERGDVVGRGGAQVHGSPGSGPVLTGCYSKSRVAGRPSACDATDRAGRAGRARTPRMAAVPPSGLLLRERDVSRSPRRARRRRPCGSRGARRPRRCARP